MADAPILSWENLGLQQGGRWLFRELDLHIGPRDRLALIGRNGAGKTTLFRLIADQIEADKGKRSIQPGTKVVLLEQEPDLAPFATLMDFALAVDPHGGGAPQRYEVVAISHDRTFLKRLTRATLWLDRGSMRRKEVGFGGYEAWEEAVYAEEARAAEKLDARLKLEAHWLERGMTARRKRNQGRLEKLYGMRAQRAAMLNPQGAAKLALATDEESRSKTVINAEHVTKRYSLAVRGEPVEPRTSRDIRPST